MISRWWWGPKTGGEVWPKDRWFRSFDGTKIRYAALGPSDAPVVTFNAGFLCPDTYWTYLVPKVAERYRVIVWNYRGIGASELPRSPGFHAYAIADEELSIETNAHDLWGLLEHEGVERSVIVGHSMGCQTSLEAYRQYPSKVAAMVLIAGPYRTPLRTFYGTDLASRAMPFALPLLHLLPRVTLLGWRALLHNPASFPIGQKVLRAIGPKAKADDMRGYFDHVSMVDPLIAAKMVRAMHSHDAEDVLDKIDVPVLILHGTSDPFTPIVIAEEMASRIPGARLVTFEGGAHTLPIEMPDELGAELLPFLDSVAGLRLADPA